MSETPDWLTEGSEVVVVQTWDRGSLKAESTTVERILKRDVVLANGERFNKATLSKSLGTWSVSHEVVPPTDPRVAKTRAKIRLQRAELNAQVAYEAWRRDHSATTARDAAAALTTLAEMYPTEDPA